MNARSSSGQDTTRSPPTGTGLGRGCHPPSTHGGVTFDATIVSTTSTRNDRPTVVYEKTMTRPFVDGPEGYDLFCSWRQCNAIPVVSSRNGAKRCRVPSLYTTKFSWLYHHWIGHDSETSQVGIRKEVYNQRGAWICRGETIH